MINVRSKIKHSLGQLIASLVLIGALNSLTAFADEPQHLIAERSLQIYMPQFGGKEELGRNVATVLNLSLWRTLRKAPYPNPKNLDFGNGEVLWDDQPLPEPAARSASQALLATESDMVLWGTARNYGPGVLVQAYLLTRPANRNDAGGAMWRISIGSTFIELGLPRELFSFSGVELRPDLVQRFSQPSALHICPTKTLDCDGPTVGGAMKAHRHEPPWSYVTTPDGRAGWIYVDDIGTKPNEIVTFTGALAAYFRGDFQQAARLFQMAAAVGSADWVVREDALLLSAAALSRLGQNETLIVEQIRSSDPYSRYALQVAVMTALSQVSTAGNKSSVNRPLIRSLLTKLRESEDLFDEADHWLPRAEAALEQLLQ